MSVTRSSVFLLARLKARKELEKSSSSTREAILAFLENKDRVSKTLREAYDYIPTRHATLYIKHRIGSTCGCMQCEARNNYVFEKLEYRRFKEGFYDPYSPRWSDINGNTLFNMMYNNYKHECGEALDEGTYFTIRSKEYEEKIQQLRVAYRSIKDTINSLMST